MFIEAPWPRLVFERLLAKQRTNDALRCDCGGRYSVLPICLVCRECGAEVRACPEEAFGRK